MNIRKMKLAITVDLLNEEAAQKPLLYAKNAMKKFKHEAGSFKGLLQTGTSKINDAIERKSFALQYEFCTLNLDLVTDHHSNMEFVQHFDLTAN